MKPIRFARFITPVALASALSACTSPLMRSVAEEELVASGAWSVITGIDVPPVAGIDGCGAQALAAAMAHRDPSLDAAGVARSLPWHDVGATPVDLLLEARERGFEAEITSGTWSALEADVAAGDPVLLMFDAAPEVHTISRRIPTTRVMHWGLLGGMSSDGARILIARDGGRHHVMTRDEFMRRWDASDRCRISIEAAPPPPPPPLSSVP